SNIILTIQIVSVGQTVVSERYTYVSYIGLFFIVGRFYCDVVDNKLQRAKAIKSYLQLILVAYAIVFCVLTWERNRVWKDTLTLFSDAIEKDPTAPTPYKNRGLARYHQNDFQGAISDFTKSLQLYSNDVELYLDRGASRFALRDYAGANTDFETALKMKPDNADALVNSGNAKAMLGDIDGSLAQFKKAIELDPKHGYAYYNRGQLKLKMQNTAEACGDWRKAAELGYPDAQQMIQRHCQ
ncbi:MAG: tetratricopeptide repeat protein, partial [Bacteroidota bacterium]